jgi:Ca2+-binding EF-hand superfamily protein
VTLRDVIAEGLAILFRRQNPRYDINHDGRVNLGDLLLMMSQLGKSC